MQIHEASTSSKPASWQALREPAVCAACGFSKSQLWRLIKQGKFPRPVKISERCNGWDSRQVDAWLAEKFGGGK